MPVDEFSQREQEFETFGRLVAQQHRRNRANRQRSAANPAPERLGRDLAAARANAGLSPAELAGQARLPLSTLLALEHGLLPVTEIKPGWLERLAAVLDEDVSHLTLLWGPVSAPPQRRSLPKLRWPVFRLQFATGPLYATLSALVLCLLLSVALLPEIRLPALTPEPYRAAAVTEATSATQLNPTAPLPSARFANIAPETRLSLIKAEKQKVYLTQLRATEPTPPLNVTNPDFENAYRLFWSASRQSNITHIHQATGFNFNNPVLLLPAWSIERRFNIPKAEYRLENQIFVPRTLIDVNPGDRLSLAKAEYKL